jgi:hypothetical protein
MMPLSLIVQTKGAVPRANGMAVLQDSTGAGLMKLPVGFS